MKEMVRNKFILFVIRNHTVWKTRNKAKLDHRALDNTERSWGLAGEGFACENIFTTVTKVVNLEAAGAPHTTVKTLIKLNITLIM